MLLDFGGTWILFSRHGRVWIYSPNWGHIVCEPQPVKDWQKFGYITVYIKIGNKRFFWSTEEV